MPGERWAGVPAPVRRVAHIAAGVLGYGAVVHAVHPVLGGWNPYSSLPVWLAVYFVSLTLLDPVAAVLLLFRRRAGLGLGCAGLVSDAVANGYANYVIDAASGLTAGRVGQAVISVLAVALLTTAPRLWPWLHPLTTPRWPIPYGTQAPGLLGPRQRGRRRSCCGSRTDLDQSGLNG